MFGAETAIVAPCRMVPWRSPSFRCIVSPDDALEMTDLCAFTRDLMTRGGSVFRNQPRKL
jgi:hypothetical protein